MLSEREGVERIRQGQIIVEPLRMTTSKAPVGSDIDLLLDLEWEGRTHTFMVEYKGVPTPRRIDEAIARLKHDTRQYPNYLPMVAAPVLSNVIIERLIAEQISGIDLSGNYAIIVPGQWLIVKSGQSNKFPTSQPIKNVYEGTSSLVARALLRRREFEKAKDLQYEIRNCGGTISKGTISKVLKVLEEDLFIRTSPTIKVLQPEGLLDQLASGYKRPQYMRRVAGKGFIDDSVLGAVRREAEKRAERVIGRNEELYATAPRSDQFLTLYTSNIEMILSVLPLEVDHRFANVELLQIEDQTVYFDPTEEDGFVWCSPLQMYLELVNGGKREQDAAATLKHRIIG